MSYQLGAELLNFGAFIGFMGVNLAAFVRYFVREQPQDLPQFGAAAAGLRDLPLHLVQPADPGQAGRAGLAGGGAGLRGLEDEGIQTAKDVQ